MIEELKNICELVENAEIRNTFKLKSTCFAMITPNNEEELIESLEILKKNDFKFIVLGNASNVILPEYYDGVVISLSKLNNYEVRDNLVYVQSGCMINKLANDLVNLGYGGLDFACGIPGTVGGSVYGNAGCYGSSISEVLVSAHLYDVKNEKIVEFSNEDFKYDYRYSILKDNKDYVIISAIFKIEKKDIDELKALVKERNEKRISSQDLTHPSNGSVFRNPEGYSAGKLIDDLGLKGTCVNDAMVSFKHANFIINNGNAKSEDIIELIDLIKKKVKEEYDIDLVLEQEIIK